MATVEIKFIKTVVYDLITNKIISSTDTVESNNNHCMTKSKIQEVVKEDNINLIVENNKLHLSPSIIELLKVSPGDRISINYVSKDNNFIPIIGKSGILGDSSAGNKLSNSLTVSFRGKQLTTLEQFGNNFTLTRDDKLPDNVYYLIDSINGEKLETIKDDELIDENDIILNEENNSLLNDNDELIIEDNTNILNFDDNSLDISQNIINFDFKLD